MADETELHPVVQLLLARMDSHPEEFEGPYSNRWGTILGQVRDVAQGADSEALEAAYSKLRLNELHEDMMDELLNGEERRAEAEWQRQGKLAQSIAQQQAIAQQRAVQLYDNQYHNQYNNQYANALGVGTQPSSLNIGGETLTGDILKTIKRKVGL